MTFRNALTLLVISAVAAASPLHSPTSPLAPLYTSSASPTDVFDDSYVVMFQDTTAPEAFSTHMNFLASMSELYSLQAEGEDRFGIRHVYDSVVAKGYSGKFPEDVISIIRSRPEVKYVEQDGVVHLHVAQNEDRESQTYGYNIQKKPPWGLSRLNHRGRIYTSNWDYAYDTRAGSGAVVYVIDTGIRSTHKEFEGRALTSKTFWPNESFVDYGDHGTHVAGTIASKTYGIAKWTQIRAIKIFNQHTNSVKNGRSLTIAALEWAVQDATETKRQYPALFKGAVINMSLGGSYSRALNDATNNAVRAGAFVVLSAGNNDVDACTQSPASAELAVTVGASTIDDKRAVESYWASNWGQCVDVFAPGLGIESLSPKSDIATSVKPGTSMAAPHVSGLIAYFLSIYPDRTFNPSLIDLQECDASAYTPRLFDKDESLPLMPQSAITPHMMKNAIIQLSSKGKLADVRGSPNRVAYNNFAHGHESSHVTDGVLDQYTWF